MEYNLPPRLSSEKDLRYYEQYIESESNLLKSVCDTENKRNLPMETKTQKIKITDKNSSYYDDTKPQKKSYRNDYLKNHIGKLIKVESLICERLESRIGILMEVGNDYIVIKPNRSCCSMVIGSQSIEYITIIHNNAGITKY